MTMPRDLLRYFPVFDQPDGRTKAARDAKKKAEEEERFRRLFGLPAPPVGQRPDDLAVPVPQPVPPPEFKPTPPAVLSQILKRLTPRPGEVEFYKGLGEALTQLVRRSPEQEEALRRSQEMRLVAGPGGERFMERVGGAPATGMRFLPPLAEGPTTVPQTIGRMLPTFMGIFPPLTSEEQQAQVAGVERLDPLSMMAAAAYAVPGAAQMEAFAQAGLRAAPYLGYARGAAEEAASAAAQQARAAARAAGPTARRLAVGEAGGVGRAPITKKSLLAEAKRFNSPETFIGDIQRQAGVFDAEGKPVPMLGPKPKGSEIGAAKIDFIHTLPPSKEGRQGWFYKARDIWEEAHGEPAPSKVLLEPAPPAAPFPGRVVRAEAAVPFGGRAVPAAAKVAAPEGPYAAFMTRLLRKKVMDDAGQAILDDLANQGKSPQRVSEEFWASTYPKLRPEVQSRFERYLKKVTGKEPGDTIAKDAQGNLIRARNWQDVANAAELPQGPDGADMLEGIERGYVVLMEEGNKRFAVRPEPLSLPLAPAEVLADYPALAALPGEGLAAQVGKVAPAVPKPPIVAEAVAPGVRFTAFEKGAPPANPQEMYNWARGALTTDELSRRLTQATTAPRLTPKNRAAAVKIIREAEKSHPEWKEAYEEAVRVVPKPSPVLPPVGRTIAREAPAGIPPPSVAPPAEAVAAPLAVPAEAGRLVPTMAEPTLPPRMTREQVWEAIQRGEGGIPARPAPGLPTEPPIALGGRIPPSGGVPTTFETAHPPSPETWIPLVRSNDEILAMAYKPDWTRRFADWATAKHPIFGKALQVVGIPERGVIKESMVLRESIMADWESNSVGAMSRLRSLGESKKLFNVDDQGRALIGETRVAFRAVQEHPDRYPLTTQQRQFLQTLHRLEDNKLAALEAEGIEVRLLSFEEGGHYVGGRVMGRVGAEGDVELAYIGGPRRPGAKAPFEKVRGFEPGQEEEALQLGYRYLSPEGAMQANMTAAGRRIADKRASELILSQVPYRTGVAPEELLVARDFAAQKLGRATTYRALLERSLRGEKLPEASIRSVAASFPGEVRELRAAQALEGKAARVALRDLRANAKAVIGQSQQDFYRAQSAASKAKEVAMAPRLGEAGVQAPAFAGKFFSVQEADAINKAMGLAPLPLWGSVAQGVAWLNAPFRLMITTFDLGVGAIQLQVAAAKNPIVWGKVNIRGLEALASGQRYQQFLATHAKTISEWSPHGAIFTPSEFTEALRGGGAIARVPVLREIARPFGRYFEGILNAAEIYGLEATGSIAKTAGQKADLAAHWNVMTGRIDTARRGITAAQRYAETAALFAPRFRRSAYTLMTDIARGGIRGEQAREALAKLSIAGLLGYIGLAKALGQEPVLDPRERGKWMTLEIAGQRVGLGSAYVMTARLLAQVGVEIATGHPENIGPYAASYAKGLLAPVPGTGIDIAFRPYYGGPGIDRALQLTKRVVAENLVPAWSSQIIERKPYHSWETTAVGVGAEAVAFRAFPAGPGQLRFKWRDDLEAFEKIPSDSIQAAADYRDGTTAAVSREAYRQQNPDVDAKLFITGEVSALQTDAAVSAALAYIQENKIDPDSIRGVRLNKADREKRQKLGVGQGKMMPTDRLVLELEAQREESASVPTMSLEDFKRKHLEGGEPTPTPTATMSLEDFKRKHLQPVGTR